MKNEKRKLFERTGIASGKKGGDSMTTEDRMLMVETISEIKELKGQMKEFKEHVIGRVEKPEKRRGKGARKEFRLSVF